MKIPLLPLLVLTCLLRPAMLFAQDEKELRPVTRTYALTNATVIQAPGRKLEHGTVVIKNGLILSVGAATKPPADAIVIKADSLFVYAGFIDGLSRTGVTKPKDDVPRERPKEPGNPTYERAGITPQAEVITTLAPSDKSVEDMRSVGFTLAQVVPYGNMLPGSGALIFLNGKSASKMVLEGSSSLYAELSPTQGAYPNTVIGVIAKWHELYRQATSNYGYETLYAANRNGLEPPTVNRTLQAFYPVIEKKMPVLFKAEKMLDVYRVMSLQADLGFPLILADVKEGWMLTDKIKAAGVNVFLSLDLPEDKKDEDKKSDDKTDKSSKENEKPATEKKKEEKKDTVAKVRTPDEREKDALEKRKAELVAKYNGQASVYQKAGIHFGFASLGSKPKDIPANLRKIISAGLPENEALAALTTYPAQILGLSDRLGTIDAGKIADLVVTDRSYFNEKANVRWIFVDGEAYKVEVKDAKKNAKDQIAGTWSLSSETPQGKSDLKVTFIKNGDAWSGTISGDNITSTTEAKALSYADHHLKFSFSIIVNGAPVEVVVDGKVDGATFTGTSAAGSGGTVAMTGTKDPKL